MPYLTIEQADRLRDAADEHGADYRGDYSGRFMYGARCIGLTGSLAAITAAIAEAAMTDPELGRLLIRSESRSDSMGLDTIMYWPDLTEEESAGQTADDDQVDAMLGDWQHKMDAR